MDLSGLGPYFALHAADSGQWRPLRDLLDAEVIGERIDHVARALKALSGHDIEQRVAASTMSLGLFARLVSPVLGAAALETPLAPLDLDDTHWQPAESGPWPLRLTGTPVVTDPARDLTTVVLPLADAIGDHVSLSSHVLRGNVASAVFGAVRMISMARPDLRTTALELGRSLLDSPLAGAGDIDQGRGFVRSSCCLYYRIPGGGYCGDCVLAH